MAFEDPFANPLGWRTSWTPPKDGSLPQNVFASSGILLIGIAEEETPSEPTTYNLAWLDESGRWSSLTGLHLPGTQSPSTCSVSRGGTTSTWYVKLIPDTRTTFTLKLSVKKFLEDPAVGTLTAMANPIGGGPPVYRRPPHWLRWLQRLFHSPDEPGRDERTAV